MRRVCPTCAKVVAIVESAAGGIGLGGLVDIFKAEGLSQEQVDRVLDAHIGSRPNLRDHLTSRMANTLMRGLGMPGRQSPEDVQRVRQRLAGGRGEGTWVADEKSPPGIH